MRTLEADLWSGPLCLITTCLTNTYSIVVFLPEKRVRLYLPLKGVRKVRHRETLLTCGTGKGLIKLIHFQFLLLLSLRTLTEFLSAVETKTKATHKGVLRGGVEVPNWLGLSRGACSQRFFFKHHFYDMMIFL